MWTTYWPTAKRTKRRMTTFSPVVAVSWGYSRIPAGELGADRLIALIIHGNTASENVAHKLGLQYERNIMLGRREAQLFALDA